MVIEESGAMGTTAHEQQANGLAAFAGITARNLWLRPLGLLRGAAAQAAVAGGDASALAGGNLAFPLVEVLALDDGRLLSAVATVTALQRWAVEQDSALAAHVAAQLAALAATRPRWAGFALDRPLIMGALNVTPERFSHGP